MQKRIHVNDHQTIEFLSTDWGFVCFKILAEIVKLILTTKINKGWQVYIF